jgi:SWI/SNF-related matrix-associated actin-dependent regulator 1 of chromatin subfamily A
MPYQEAGAAFLAARAHAGLFDDMGLGKTCQAIRALDLRELQHGLVVCPASVRQGWVTEFAKFQKIHRRVKKGISVHDFNAWWQGGIDVLVISYERAAKWAQIVSENCITMDFIVLDESHYLKSDGAVRTQKLLGPDCAGDGLVQWADTVWYLTGTPVPNDPLDVHSFLYSSGATDLSRTKFRREFFNTHARTYSATHEVKEEKVEELRSLIGQHSIRRTLASAGLNLPPIFVTETTIDGDSTAVRDMLLAHPGLDKIIVDLLNEGKNLPALSIAHAGHIMTLRRLIGEAKALPYAQMLIEELRNGLDKIVVFGQHKNTLKTVHDFLSKHGIKCVDVTGDTRETDRVLNMTDFQNDADCRVFLGNIRAAGVGLTLTASRRLDMLESDWTPAGNAQAIKRVHRISQTRDVHARFITLADSFDEVVNEIVAEKTRRLAAIDDIAAAYAVQ